MAPTVYVVDSDPEERKWIESVLAPAATSVVFLDDGAALLAHMPLPGEACLIAFADRDRAAALELVRALRGGGTKLPVIVLGPLSAFRTAIDIARLERPTFSSVRSVRGSCSARCEPPRN